MLSTWHTAADAEYQAKSNIREAMHHVSCHSCCGGATVTQGHNGNNDIMPSGPTQGIVFFFFFYCGK